jgi:hypothetical protein
MSREAAMGSPTAPFLSLAPYREVREAVPDGAD